MKMKFNTLIILLASLLSSAFLQETNAQDWFKTCGSEDSYDMGGDPTASHGSAEGGFIKSTESSISGFGSYATQMAPGDYLGKGIRLTAYVKTDNVDNWLGLWMRVDGADTRTLSFDNMFGRSLTGTTDWEKYEIILDVPEDATQIFYGILMVGTGEAYIDGLKLQRAPRTWEIQNTGISNFITCIQAIDENTVWAGAEQGIYLKTVDGGLNWTSGSVPGAGSLTLNSIAVTSKKTAYFVGSDFFVGRIYKTIDGGSNWTEQYALPGGSFTSIAFWDQSHGIAIGYDNPNSRFLILTTNNAGADWNEVPQENIPPTHLGERAGRGNDSGTSLAVAGNNHVWFGTAYEFASSDPVRVFKSTDQGQTWTVSNTTLTTDGQFHGVSTMAFKDSLTGFATSNSSLNSDSVTTLVKTIDGGENWTEVPSFLPLHPSTLVYVPNSNDSILFVTSRQGAGYSGDGGQTWVRRSTQPYFALSFASPTAGWAAAGSRIVKFVPDDFMIVAEHEPFRQEEVLQLSQNYPNPFNSSTTIEYVLRKPGHVTLKVIDLTGQELETVVDGFNPAGKHQVNWQPKGLASGVYVYQIKADGFFITKKLLFQR